MSICEYCGAEFSPDEERLCDEQGNDGSGPWYCSAEDLPDPNLLDPERDIEGYDFDVEALYQGGYDGNE